MCGAFAILAVFFERDVIVGYMPNSMTLAGIPRKEQLGNLTGPTNTSTVAGTLNGAC